MEQANDLKSNRGQHASMHAEEESALDRLDRACF